MSTTSCALTVRPEGGQVTVVGLPHTSAAGPPEGRANLVDSLIDRLSVDLRREVSGDGQFIGTQSDLCRRYSVSQPVLLQAVRVLTYRGLVELRAGNRGGVYAVNRTLSLCGKRFATYLELTGVTFADAAPVSALLQGMVVRLATGNLSLEQADAIRVLARRFSEVDYFDRGVLMSRMFQHFADATGNPVLALFYRLITDVMLDLTVHSHRDSDRVVPQKVLIDLARQIADGVIAADHQGAAEYFRLFSDNLFRKIGGAEELQVAVVLETAFKSREVPKGKLAERLASHILREIRALNQPAGSRLGDEPELMARFGVSRATFRQAIRLLEEYAAVETRRGPGGGLWTTAPNPDQIAHTALWFLRQSGVCLEHTRPLLEQLLVLALERLMVDHSSQCGRLVELGPLQLSGGRPHGEFARTLLDLGQFKTLGLMVDLLAALELQLGGGPPPNPQRREQLLTALVLAVAGSDLVRARGALAELVRTQGAGFGAGQGPWLGEQAAPGR